MFYSHTFDLKEATWSAGVSEYYQERIYPLHCLTCQILRELGGCRYQGSHSYSPTQHQVFPARNRGIILPFNSVLLCQQFTPRVLFLTLIFHYLISTNIYKYMHLHMCTCMFHDSLSTFLCLFYYRVSLVFVHISYTSLLFSHHLTSSHLCPLYL